MKRYALHRWGKAWSRVKEYKWKCQGCGSKSFFKRLWASDLQLHCSEALRQRTNVIVCYMKIDSIMEKNNYSEKHRKYRE